MTYKQKADQIRIAILLIKERRISNATRQRKLQEIADLCEMYNYGDFLKSEFVEESLKMQRLNQQVKWIRYLRDTLLFTERYELLHELKLEKL